MFNLGNGLNGAIKKTQKNKGRKCINVNSNSKSV
jgi:hypothetical protein